MTIPELLAAIRAADPSADGRETEPDAETRYAARNKLIHRLVADAIELGWPAGYSTHEIIVDGIRQDWPIAYVQLPTGLVSWHIRPFQVQYDGHTTAEKYQRCAALGTPSPAHETETAELKAKPDAAEAKLATVWFLAERGARKGYDLDANEVLEALGDPS